ncbi:hypothetical protein Daura_28480 [Dactylosporangium aurantiacum]|uniref:Uncharacterized protein n=1 Tax=Dactylosporangium aurantiacum TaxID=35754 RepID=A0A9Q9IAB1_9ACTN|nr:hypothetical protein [Dactylosporangium aurantiacum]MDG6106588.1 hypothetical protein [Dactylosporangium aurantiacum]UWZ50750.1 hypothetical protein Daura_28480 [Dactylosporangium aurantiacum]
MVPFDAGDPGLWRINPHHGPDGGTGDATAPPPDAAGPAPHGPVGAFGPIAHPHTDAGHAQVHRDAGVPDAPRDATAGAVREDPREPNPYQDGTFFQRPEQQATDPADAAAPVPQLAGAAFTTVDVAPAGGQFPGVAGPAGILPPTPGTDPDHASLAPAPPPADAGPDHPGVAPAPPTPDASAGTTSDAGVAEHHLAGAKFTQTEIVTGQPDLPGVAGPAGVSGQSEHGDAGVPGHHELAGGTFTATEHEAGHETAGAAHTVLGH